MCLPGLAVKRYAGSLMTDSHFMELQCSASMVDVDSRLETLPMFVPTLWCLDPKVVSAVVGSRFGCGPRVSTECGTGWFTKLRFTKFRSLAKINQKFASVHRWTRVAHQGASLEAGVTPEKVKATGSVQSGATPEVNEGEVEWEPMWDGVINSISDGRKLDSDVVKKLAQLKGKAVKCAAVWQTYIGKQLASDRCFQQKYLRNTTSWVYACLEAAELVGVKQEWPLLLEASIRDGTNSFTGEVELTHLQEYFRKTAVPPEQVRLMVTQVVKSQSLEFRERRVRFRGKLLPSCKGYEKEIAAQNWLDASRGQVVIAGPECLLAMGAGEIMCHPNARVPQNDTTTGVATGNGMLITHLSFQPIKADVLKLLSRNQSVERPSET